jgi:hypothetical protein
MTAAKPSVAAWYIPDVHSWTGIIRMTVRDEMPELPEATRQRMEQDNPRQVFEQAMFVFWDRVRSWPNAMAVKNVLTKFEERVLVVDPELDNMSPSGLLIITFDMVQTIEPIFDKDHEPNKDGAWRALFDTLLETAGTCVQGDTHRLFALFVALYREQSRYRNVELKGEKPAPRKVSAKTIAHTILSKDVKDMFVLNPEKNLMTNKIELSGQIMTTKLVRKEDIMMKRGSSSRSVQYVNVNNVST